MPANPPRPRQLLSSSAPPLRSVWSVWWFQLVQARFVCCLSCRRQSGSAAQGPTWLPHHRRLGTNASGLICPHLMTIPHGANRVVVIDCFDGRDIAPRPAGWVHAGYMGTRTAHQYLPTSSGRLHFTLHLPSAIAVSAQPSSSILLPTGTLPAATVFHVFPPPLAFAPGTFMLWVPVPFPDTDQPNLCRRVFLLLFFFCVLSLPLCFIPLAHPGSTWV